MNKTLLATGAAALLALAGCNTPAPTASTQMTPASAGASSGMPQSANSLPANGTANGPVAPATGSVSNTRTR